VQRWSERRHIIGNHTWTHRWYDNLPEEQFGDDMLRCDAFVRRYPGFRPYFRFPALKEGATRERRDWMRAFLKAHGYRIAQVTLDWEDYMWNFAYARCAAKNDAKAIEWLRSSYLSTASEFIDLGREQAKLIYGHEINYVLLLHLGAFSSTILPDALDLLKKKGFKLVTLEEAESDAAYEGDPDVGLRDAGTLLDQWMQVKQFEYPEHAEKPYKEIESVCQ